MREGAFLLSGRDIPDPGNAFGCCRKREPIRREGYGSDRVLVPELRALLTGHHIPNAGSPIIRCRSNPLTIARESNRPDILQVPCENGPFLARRHIPDARNPVVRRRNETAMVG